VFDLTRLRLAKAGYSLSHPSCWSALARGVTPSIEHFTMLRAVAPDLVLDVGANRGQFTLMARMIHPNVPIRAYEPLPAAGTVFRRVHSHRLGVELFETALGDVQGSSELHVSRQADSSSLLPIGRLQTRIFQHTEESGTLRVMVTTLDGLPDHWRAARNALLKIDVQGYELNVLRGASAAMQHCAYVYAECSEVQLYTGQAVRKDVEAFLISHGFTVRRRFNPSFYDGNLIQADYLFGRH
jgi:FkbM family methyltransferase